MLFDSILQSLKDNDPTLTSLRTRRFGFGPENIKDLAEILKTNTTLTKLEVDHCDIGSEGAKHLAEALKTNKTLTKLFLCTTFIKSEGARYLAEALQINNTLNTLVLQHNFIEYNGGMYIAEVLKTNSSLNYLILDDECIGSKGAKYIGEALKINTSLTYLNLDRNYIEAIGAKYICEALEINTTLIQFHCNDIDKATITRIITRNKNLSIKGLENLITSLQETEGILAFATTAVFIYGEPIKESLLSIIKIEEEKIKDLKKTHQNPSQLIKLELLWQQTKIRIFTHFPNEFDIKATIEMLFNLGEEVLSAAAG